MSKWIEASSQTAKKTVELPETVTIEQAYKGAGDHTFAIPISKISSKVLAKMVGYAIEVLVQRSAAIGEAEYKKDPKIGAKKAAAMRKRIDGWVEGIWSQGGVRREAYIVKSIAFVKAALKSQQARREAFEKVTIVTQADFEAACVKAKVKKEKVAEIVAKQKAIVEQERNAVEEAAI